MNISGYPADPAGFAGPFRQPPAAAYIGGRVARVSGEKRNPATSEKRQGSKTDTPRKPRPRWLADKIAVNARQAHPATCTGCGTPVLAGPDGNTAAMVAMVNPDPATPLQQLRHLINGHRTYTLAARELDLVDHHGPACTLPVHLEHICQEATP